MPFILGLLGKIAMSPVVSKVILPWFGDWLAGLFERKAEKLETRAAVKVVKAAKTADELREASRRLSDASSHNQ